MSRPEITIAMPFYNAATTLELSLRSLLNQTYGDFELLLCDDGSTDQGLAVARSFDDRRIICWSDGRHRRLAGRLNECIDRARGSYFARMDADDISYPERFALQLDFLASEPAVDLCGARALVFGKQGRPLWRFTPSCDHAGITVSPFRGFPIWHPVWMGRTRWFRSWGYNDSAWLAQDQELLLRSHRESLFANLPEILLGYRKEHTSLRKLFRYKLLHIQSLRHLSAGELDAVDKLQLFGVSAARFAVNCVAAVAGPERRIGHQAAHPLTGVELAQWSTLWDLLTHWYGKPVNELFKPSSLLPGTGGWSGFQ
jgi:glycosyltransferase involved in cell wall biosynthesis